MPRRCTAKSLRKIASNKALTHQGVIDNPLVELDERGVVVRITRCETPDREPFTEHYAGLLVVGLDDALQKELLSRHDPLPDWLPERLPQQGELYLVTGLDYHSLCTTPHTTFRRLG